MKISSRSVFNASTRLFIGGLALHEAELPAVAAVCSVPEITNLYNGSRAREQTYQQSRDGKRESLEALGQARETGRAFIAKSKQNLIPYLGAEWSEAWTPLGYTSAAAGLAMPKAAGRIVDMLDNLETYYAANPGRQNASLQLTAAAAKQHRENLELAVSTVARCRREQRTNRDLRAAADLALAVKVAAGRKVLAAVLPENDPRWLDFRTDVPGDLDRPESVEGVRWQAGTAGRIIVRWEPSARAESYVVQVFVEGQDTAFRNEATVRDAVADLGFAPGAKVQVRVIARNASGPTVPSETVSAQAPLAAVA